MGTRDIGYIGNEIIRATAGSPSSIYVFQQEVEKATLINNSSTDSIFFNINGSAWETGSTVGELKRLTSVDLLSKCGSVGIGTATGTSGVFTLIGYY